MQQVLTGAAKVLGLAGLVAIVGCAAQQTTALRDELTGEIEKVSQKADAASLSATDASRAANEARIAAEEARTMAADAKAAAEATETKVDRMFEKSMMK